MKTNERVILIKGDATKWYDQAIFIVSKNMPPDKVPVDFVAEAERIINSYIVKKSRQGQVKLEVKKNTRRTRNRFDAALNFIMLLGCVVIAAALLFGLLNG